HRLIRDDLDVFAPGGYLQFLHCLVKSLANLLFRVLVDDRKSRLFGHLVGQLVLGHIRGNNLVGHKGAINEDHRPQNGFDRPAAMLSSGTSEGIKAPLVGLKHQTLPPRITARYLAVKRQETSAAHVTSS